MGHSRGAKLAALIYATGLQPVGARHTLARQLSLVLVDPVDSGGEGEHDSQGPSAVEALAGRGGQAAVVGERNGFSRLL